jgi:hypothetical protein
MLSRMLWSMVLLTGVDLTVSGFSSNSIWQIVVSAFLLSFFSDRVLRD